MSTNTYDVIDATASTVTVRLSDGHTETAARADIEAAAEQDDPELARVYRHILAGADWHLAERARVAAVRAHREHVVASESGPWPFAGAVARQQVPAAHGGVVMVETCGCGARRQVAVNGVHREVGAWS